MTRHYPLFLFAALALAGCSSSEEVGPNFTGGGAMVEVMGEPRNCLPLSQLRDSQVRDDRTIDFRMAGGDIYRSTLPQACPRLGFERSFNYTTGLTQLCSQEIIYVLQRFGDRLERGAGCGLGEFVPIRYVAPQRGQLGDAPPIMER